MEENKKKETVDTDDSEGTKSEKDVEESKVDVTVELANMKVDNGPRFVRHEDIKSAETAKPESAKVIESDSAETAEPKSAEQIEEDEKIGDIESIQEKEMMYGERGSKRSYKSLAVVVVMLLVFFIVMFVPQIVGMGKEQLSLSVFLDGTSVEFNAFLNGVEYNDELVKIAKHDLKLELDQFVEEITLEGMILSSAEIGFSIGEAESAAFKGVRVDRSYYIEVPEIEYSNGEIAIIADGETLYRCIRMQKDECSEWKGIKRITPNKQYKTRIFKGRNMFLEVSEQDV